MAAFLHGDLNEVIYMRQPEGFNNGTDHVAQLLRSLYGLKQAARCWYKLLHKELLAVEYTQLVSDTAVYI